MCIILDIAQRLSISYYKTIATINSEHKIYLVQHQETKKIFIKKILDVYNINIYNQLLTHPILGTPTIYEIYEENNQLIVIEQYISGCSLQEKINSHSITIDDIYHYALELCSILEIMHSFVPPIVHRDIKPSNILITDYNHLVLLDFNAAKYYTTNSDTDTVLLGTQGYAAPEQYGFGTSSPKTDIYTFGILLKELSMSLSNVPKELTQLIMKCIQLNPDDRYNSIAEIKTIIENIQSNTFQSTTQFTTLSSYFLPGFRTLKAWKMLIATPIYLFILWLSFSLQVENTYGLALWIERFFCMLIFLSIIFGCFNYLDIQSWVPLCKSKNKLIHYIGIILLDIMLVSSLFIIMFLIESIFS